MLEIPGSVWGWGQKWAQLGRCWPGIVADLCCTSSRLGWSDPSRLQHHSFTGFSQYVCLLGSLLLGNKLIFDDGWKDTWSRDSIIGPPVVPVAQDTEKRDLKWTRVELFLYQRLLDRYLIFNYLERRTFVSIYYLERRQDMKASWANQSIVEHTLNRFDQNISLKSYLCHLWAVQLELYCQNEKLDNIEQNLTK